METRIGLSCARAPKRLLAPGMPVDRVPGVLKEVGRGLVREAVGHLSGCLSMSHHRETVTAAGAPAAAGPYSHAVKSGGLVFLSGQVPVDPDAGKLVEVDIGDQTRRCLDNLGVVAAAAG